MDKTKEAMRQIFGTGEMSPFDDRQMYQIKSFVASLPVFGDFMRYRDNMSYMDDYLRNRGLSYSDIRYPTRTVGFGSYGGGLNYVSKNVERLYSDEGPKAKPKTIYISYK